MLLSFRIKKGITSNPDVWINEEYSKSNVRSLIIKVSSYTV